MRALAALAAPGFVALLAGCELREVTTTEPADVVVAEVVLWAGRAQQTAFLHRSFGGEGSQVEGATVVVRGDDGGVLRFEPTQVGGICTLPGQHEGTCYVSDPFSSYAVVPGERYHLEIELADGGRLRGVTTVPGWFHLVQPARTSVGGSCSVPPGTQLELTWTRAEGAWVYVVEADFGATLRQAFPDIESPMPFRTLGLSVGGADTTLVFPAEMGLFDRFDEDATGVLAALQAGLPAAADAEVVVAAADRNYVNWVRGGTFNPSGTVRIASVEGDGTGVFGSLGVHAFRVWAGRTNLPSCLR